MLNNSLMVHLKLSLRRIRGHVFRNFKFCQRILIRFNEILFGYMSSVSEHAQLADTRAVIFSFEQLKLMKPYDQNIFLSWRFRWEIEAKSVGGRGDGRSKLWRIPRNVAGWFVWTDAHDGLFKSQQRRIKKNSQILTYKRWLFNSAQQQQQQLYKKASHFKPLNLIIIIHWTVHEEKKQENPNAGEMSVFSAEQTTRDNEKRERPLDFHARSNKVEAKCYRHDEFWILYYVFCGAAKSSCLSDRKGREREKKREEEKEKECEGGSIAERTQLLRLSNVARLVF